MLHFKEHNQPAFDELAWAVRTGGNAWRKTHDGLSQFEWLQQDPKEEHKFSKAMQQVDGLGEQASHTKAFLLWVELDIRKNCSTIGWELSTEAKPIGSISGVNKADSL